MAEHVCTIIKGFGPPKKSKNFFDVLEVGDKKYDMVPFNMTATTENLCTPVQRAGGYGIYRTLSGRLFAFRRDTGDLRKWYELKPKDGEE